MQVSTAQKQKHSTAAAHAGAHRGNFVGGHGKVQRHHLGLRQAQQAVHACGARRSGLVHHDIPHALPGQQLLDQADLWRVESRGVRKESRMQAAAP